MEPIAIFFFLFSVVVFFLLIGSVIKPDAKLYLRLLRKPLRRRQLIKRLGLVFLGSFILFVIFAPPVNPEITRLNIQKDQDVLTETYIIEGEFKGDLATFKINDEDAVINGSKFTKEVMLNPGNNIVKVVATAVKDNVTKEIKNETYNIYFDYEGMLYAEQLIKDQQAAEELRKKLEHVPQYETVRKEGVSDGFSAIIYMEGEPEDYLVTNVIKDFKSKNKDKNIALLLFKKSDKEMVEQILESENANGIVPYVRANYEKREVQEQLFLFPAGLEGTKLAVEV